MSSWCPQAAGTAPPALLLPPLLPWNGGPDCCRCGGHREGINAPRTLCTSSALTAQAMCKGTSRARPTLGLLPSGCGVSSNRVHGSIDPRAGPVLGTEA